MHVIQIGCDRAGTTATTASHTAEHATVEITTANFEELVTNGSKPVLLDFWAPWCGPCVKLTPTIEELAKKYDGRFVVGKVNVDEEPDLAQTYGASSIPLLVFLKDGEVATTSLGFQSKEEIESDMQALLE